MHIVNATHEKSYNNVLDSPRTELNLRTARRSQVHNITFTSPTYDVIQKLTCAVNVNHHVIFEKKKDETIDTKHWSGSKELVF